MDVKCLTCGEPWDVYHLLHEEVWETNLSESQKQNFIAAKHLKKHEEAFEALGWKFIRHNILCIRHCPCCPELKANKEDVVAVGLLADLFGDDLDGLAATLEDFNL